MSLVAIIDEDLKQTEPTEFELIGYKILFLKGKIAALDAMAERHWDLLSPPPQPVNLHVEVNTFEKIHLLEALRIKAGNKTRAAAMLGMSKRIFVYRCSQLGLLADGGYEDAKHRTTRNNPISTSS